MDVRKSEVVNSLQCSAENIMHSGNLVERCHKYERKNMLLSCKIKSAL